MASRAAIETPRVIALAGPTASGKSAAALAIAQRHGAEIVSVDSALVYRGMDIGTAKPSAADRGSVPHHLIDIRDPLQPYSAAEFVTDAGRLVREINARGRLALLVGGTMLYFKAWFDGLDAMPKADPAVRAELEAQAVREGWTACGTGAGRSHGGGPPRARRRAAHTAGAGSVPGVGPALVQFPCPPGPCRHRRVAGHTAVLAGAGRPRLAASAHRAALRRHAGGGFPP
jgi:hypothetical protein